MQTFEKQKDFLQPRRLERTLRHRARRSSDWTETETRASEKPVRTAAGAGGRRRRREASARLRNAAKASANRVGRRRRRGKASAGSRTAAKAGTTSATVRIFPSGTARCFGIAPRGKRSYAHNGATNDDCRSFWTAGKVATESRRNAQANRRWPKWKGEQSPDHRRQCVTSHPETAVAKSNVRSVSESGAREQSRAPFAFDTVLGASEELGTNISFAFTSCRGMIGCFGIGK